MVKLSWRFAPGEPAPGRPLSRPAAASLVGFSRQILLLLLGGAGGSRWCDRLSAAQPLVRGSCCVGRVRRARDGQCSLRPLLMDPRDHPMMVLPSCAFFRKRPLGADALPPRPFQFPTGSRTRRSDRGLHPTPWPPSLPPDSDVLFFPREARFRAARRRADPRLITGFARPLLFYVAVLGVVWRGGWALGRRLVTSDVRSVQFYHSGFSLRIPRVRFSQPHNPGARIRGPPLVRQYIPLDFCFFSHRFSVG